MIRLDTGRGFSPFPRDENMALRFSYAAHSIQDFFDSKKEVIEEALETEEDWETRVVTAQLPYLVFLQAKHAYKQRGAKEKTPFYYASSAIDFKQLRHIKGQDNPQLPATMRLFEEPFDPSVFMDVSQMPITSFLRFISRFYHGYTTDFNGLRNTGWQSDAKLYYLACPAFGEKLKLIGTVRIPAPEPQASPGVLVQQVQF